MHKCINKLELIVYTEIETVCTIILRNKIKSSTIIIIDRGLGTVGRLLLRRPFTSTETKVKKAHAHGQLPSKSWLLNMTQQIKLFDYKFYFILQTL